MANFSAYHIATIKAGQADPHAGNYDLFMVSYDQKRHYYEAGAGTVEEFKSFVSSAWDEIESVDDLLADAGNWFSPRHISLD